MKIYSSATCVSSVSSATSVSSSTSVSSNKNEKKNSILEKLEPYYVETRHINYIWTSDSTSKTSTTDCSELYQVENNRIYYIRQIKVREKVKTLLGAFPITIDKTEYIKEEECYQIPPKCRNEFLRHKVYKNSPTSLVEWIFVYEGDTLRENYFYLPNNLDINEPSIKADLLWGLHPLTPALG